VGSGGPAAQGRHRKRGLQGSGSTGLRAAVPEHRAIVGNVVRAENRLRVIYRSRACRKWAPSLRRERTRQVASETTRALRKLAELLSSELDAISEARTTAEQWLVEEANSAVRSCGFRDGAGHRHHPRGSDRRSRRFAGALPQAAAVLELLRAGYRDNPIDRLGARPSRRMEPSRDGTDARSQSQIALRCSKPSSGRRARGCPKHAEASAPPRTTSG
jgi:hypothetical protein